jgi:hypothetical protein
MAKDIEYERLKNIIFGKIIVYPLYLSKYSPSRVFPSKNTPDSSIVKIKNFIFFF